MQLRFFIVIFAIVSLLACSKRDIMFRKECDTVVNNSNFNPKILYFRWENDQMIVTLRLGSPINRDANFIFDTGGMTILSKEFCDENHIPYTQNFYNKGFSTGFGKYSESETRQYIANNINFNLDGLKITKPNMMVMDLKADSIYSCIPICGLIGSDFLSKFGFYVDFQKQKIILYDNHWNRDSIDNFDYQLFFESTPNQKCPEVFLKINGVKNYFLWDLGASEDIMVEYGKNDKNAFDKFRKSHSEIVSYITAKNVFIDFQGAPALQDSFLYYLKTDSIFYDQEAIHCTGADVNYRYSPKFIFNDGLIGIDFMKQFNMYINWKESIIYLKKNEKYKLNDSANQSFNDFGIYYNFEKKQMYVAYVKLTSKLYKIGLRPGSIIVSADNQDIQKLSTIINKCNVDSIIENIIMKSKAIGVLNEKNYKKDIFNIK